MKLSIIQNNICSLIHKQCHPKSYHSHIKYHMTLIIICNVATVHFVTHVVIYHNLAYSLQTNEGLPNFTPLN